MFRLASLLRSSIKPFKPAVVLFRSFHKFLGQSFLRSYGALLTALAESPALGPGLERAKRQSVSGDVSEARQPMIKTGLLVPLR